MADSAFGSNPPYGLKRGTFAATFFLACLAAMELGGVALDEI
jgi:hypothetical protein